MSGTDTPPPEPARADATVVIADPQTLSRLGARLLLREMIPDAAIVEVDSVDAAIEAARQSVRLLLLLLAKPLAVDGRLDGLARLLAAVPEAPVVVLTRHADDGDMIRAVRLGAKGCVVGSSSREAIRFALSLVMAGETYLPFDAAERRSGDDRAAADTDAPPRFNPIERLTPRQREVLASLLDGLSNKEIARRLALDVTTVKSHVHAILHKLGASSRTQAALHAIRLGFGRDDGPTA